MLSLDKISVSLIEATLSDEELKAELQFLKEFPIHSVVVLPHQVARCKQLLAQTQIEVASLVDYPFGSGTLAKKAFETGHLFREGAASLYIMLSAKLLVENQLYQQAIVERIQLLTFERDRLLFLFDTRELDEDTKRYFTEEWLPLNLPTAFGMDLSIQEGIYQGTLFGNHKFHRSSFQLFLANPTLLDLEMIFQTGVTLVNISNYQQLLPLIAGPK